MKRKTTPPRATYGVQEAAKILGIGRNAAYEAARRGEIPTIKIGGRILVPKAALMARMVNNDNLAFFGGTVVLIVTCSEPFDGRRVHVGG